MPHSSGEVFEVGNPAWRHACQTLTSKTAPHCHTATLHKSLEVPLCHCTCCIYGAIQTARAEHVSKNFCVQCMSNAVFKFRQLSGTWVQKGHCLTVKCLGYRVIAVSFVKFLLCGLFSSRPLCLESVERILLWWWGVHKNLITFWGNIDYHLLIKFHCSCVRK